MHEAYIWDAFVHKCMEKFYIRNVANENTVEKFKCATDRNDCIKTDRIE